MNEYTVCCDLTCAESLVKSQLRLAHSTKEWQRQTDMSEKNSLVGKKLRRELIYGEDEFSAWSGKQNK